MNKKVRNSNYRHSIAHDRIKDRLNNKDSKLFYKDKPGLEFYDNVKKAYHTQVILEQRKLQKVLNYKEKKEIFNELSFNEASNRDYFNNLGLGQPRYIPKKHRFNNK